MAVGLQRQAGNRAVAQLMAQRKAAAGPARAPATSVRPAGPGSSVLAGGPAAAVSAGGDGGAKAEAVLSGPVLDGPVLGGPVANGDVSGPVAQRLKDGVGSRPGPGSDPKFGALKKDVKSKQKTLAAHPPPRTEAAAAQSAAKPPQDDKLAQGKAANAEKMNAAKPGEFNKAAFIAAVNAAIAKQAPKNLDEADKFGSSGKADAVKGEVSGKVGDGKKASAGAIESTTKSPPDTGAAKDKPVTPLKPDQPPAKPGGPDPALAVPDKAPPAATDFSAGPAQVNAEMADAGVTEDQLAKSNEPEFTGALKEKKAGEAHAATAPGEVRAAEATTLAGAKAQATQAGATAMTAMTADRAKAGKELDAGKSGAQSEDEKKRAQVTAKLQTVFDATKRDVEAILSGLDKKVDEKFSAGEKAARDAFTADHKRRMDAYKDKRYSGLVGKGRWLKDKFAGLPEEANQIFVAARAGYVQAMQGVISTVADIIGAELNRAKARIAQGRADLQAAVQKLPKDLQAIGKEAAGEFAGKFDELTQAVDDKGSGLVETLASKYTEALRAVDAEIAAEKEKNKGLIAKAVDAVKGVIETIKNLAAMLMGVLAKAAQAVKAIIKDPIGFLGKLVSAVGAGLKQFIGNIGAHLQKGLISWLLGTAAKAGLQLPAKFDLKGILQLIASLLGLTWGSIRGRVVAKGVPEQAMTAVEAGVPVAQKIQREGIGRVWDDIKERIGDLKTTLITKVSEYLIPTVLIAGITWIVSLLNPASAFIKACKAIIDIVMFIVERGAQIIEFVNAVLDAVIAIAAGGTGGVPGLIEAALAKSIPVLIGFLAALLGIGGIANKVKSLFQALSKPVMKAVDWVVAKIVKLGKAIWNKMKAAGNKVKDRFGRDKDGKDRKGSASEGKDGKGGAEEEQAGVRLKYETPFVMHKEDHRLFVHVDKGVVSIEMASDLRQRLAFKIESAKKQAYIEKNKASRADEPERASQMQDLAWDLERLAGDLSEVEKLAKIEARGAARKRLERDILRGTTNIVAKLTELGVKYKLSSLSEFAALDHQSDYVEAMHIKLKYRNSPEAPDKFRRIFYGGWDSAHDTGGTERVRIFDEARDKLLANPAKWGSAPEFSNPRGYLCPQCGAPRIDVMGPGRFTLDHRRTVVNHWNNEGRRTTQGDRHSWYNLSSNLEAACWECNSRKGGQGEKYEYKVEPSFRGPDQ